MNISRTLSLIFLVTIECVCSQIVFLFPKRKKGYSCLYLPFAYPNQRFGWRILAYQPQFPVHIFQKEACHKGGCGTCFLGWSQMTVTVSVALRRTQRQSGGDRRCQWFCLAVFQGVLGSTNYPCHRLLSNVVFHNHGESFFRGLCSRVTKGGIP